MKLSEIKKTLGNGKLVWAECFRGESPMVVIHHPSDIQYDPNSLYVFDAFMKKEDTDSKVINFLCEKYSLKEVFVYQACFVGTSSVNPKENTLFFESPSNKVYDCDCSYLICIKKKDAECIPIDGEEFIIQNI